MAKILIGYSTCPLTRAAFEAHGHEVWTCDLLPARDNSPRHIQGDIGLALCYQWDMAVLHPMCTYLTCSAAWAFKDPDFEKYPGSGYHQKVGPETLVGEARRAAREQAIGNFRYLLGLPFPVAIENPATSFINKAIRPPDQVIHPFQFGDDASKATGLWLTRELPTLAPTAYIQPRLVCSNGHTNAYDGYSYCKDCSVEVLRPRWANQTDSGQNRLTPSKDRWLQRSATYPGIAAAMGDQWGRWLLSMSNQ